MNDDSTSFIHIAPVFQVNDLARSLAFYCDQLGFTGEYVYEGFYAAMCRDGCRIHLKCSQPALRDQAAFERAEHIDAYISVQSAEKLFSSFASAGVTFSVPLRAMPYGMEFYVRDPDGYIVGFIQPPSA